MESWNSNIHFRLSRLEYKVYNKRQRRTLYNNKGINIRGYSIHKILKSDKDTKKKERKENYRATSLMNIDAKIFWLRFSEQRVLEPVLQSWFSDFLDWYYFHCTTKDLKVLCRKNSGPWNTRTTKLQRRQKNLKKKKKIRKLNSIIH